VTARARLGGSALTRTAATLLVSTLTGCGDTTGPARDIITSPETVATPSRSPSGDPAPSRSASGTTSREESSAMSIRLTANGQTFTGNLEDSAAARDLVAMLPLSLEFEDLAGEEKWARLPHPLDVTGQPDGTAGEAGGIYHYQPWQNLALFYRPHGFADGLVRLGRLDEDAVAFLGAAPHRITITIETAR
jgi:hypothetical protein